MRDLFRPFGIAAHDITHLAFEDFGHRFIKQAQLNHAAFEKGFHLRFGNGRDVVEFMLLFRL